MRFRGKTSFGSTALGVMHDQVVKTEIRIEEFSLFFFWKFRRHQILFDETDMIKKYQELDKRCKWT